LSSDWHQFLEFEEGKEEEKASKKRKRAPFKYKADEARIDQWRRLQKIDTIA
jgi:hypothetical protein